MRAIKSPARSVSRTVPISVMMPVNMCDDASKHGGDVALETKRRKALI